MLICILCILLTTTSCVYLFRSTPGNSYLVFFPRCVTIMSIILPEVFSYYVDDVCASLTENHPVVYQIYFESEKHFV